jgi:hypothetical protein
MLEKVMIEMSQDGWMATRCVTRNEIDLSTGGCDEMAAILDHLRRVVRPTENANCCGRRGANEIKD